MVTPSAEGLGLKLEVVWNSSVLHYYSNAVLHDNASFGVVMIFVFWVNDDVISDTGVFVYDVISYTTVGPNADVGISAEVPMPSPYTSLPIITTFSSLVSWPIFDAPNNTATFALVKHNLCHNYIPDLARD